MMSSLGTIARDEQVFMLKNSVLHRAQRLLEIGDEIIRVFDAH